jgi:hypothetical protein
MIQSWSVAARSAADLQYRLRVSSATDITQNSVQSTYSTSQATTPIPANSGKTVDLAGLERQIRDVGGIAFADQLSFADLPPGSLTSSARVGGGVRVFGFDAAYVRDDGTIAITSGARSRATR